MEGSAATNPAASRAKAFEVFVKRTISQIHKEAWGRSKEVRDLREACDKFLNAIESGDSKMPQLEDMVLQVLPPLQLACQTNIPKVVELSLGCLHKLVAHAWLQGESRLSSAGSNQNGDMVADVVRIVIRHADSNSQTLQLAVLRALLTFATAEHFVAHGDCLLSAVRTVFNLALSSIDSDIKRTAGNALLQMLNTITKRVTQYHFRSSRFSDTSSALSTPVSRDAGSSFTPALSKDLRESRLTTAGSMEVEAELISDQERAAEFKRMAEQRDMRGLERALEEAAAKAAAEEAEAEAAGHVDGSSAAMSPPISPVTPGTSYVPPEVHSPAQDPGVFAAMPNLPPLKTSSKLVRTPLTLVEKDVLLVLTAFCKLASCEPEKTNAEAYMQHGKLLALELLVKVLQNPHHNWGNVRDELFRHLRQPLCLALLKNCATGDPQSFNLAVKLLVAMLLLPKLRRGLRAEMGALYPLLILRAVEQYAGGWQEGVVDSAALLQLLQVLRSLCSDAQLLVDLFVNYDCDLSAANLYERTISALSRLCSTPNDMPSSLSNTVQAKEAAAAAAVSDAALQCLQAVITSLDAWAGPLKDSLTRSGVDTLGDAATSEADFEAGGSPISKTEAEVFGAAKAQKSFLTKGIDMFKNNPVKGVAFLISTGVVERSPAKVAEFFISNLKLLNKTALGEYFGHHEEFETQVMHEFVDRQRYAGVKIDMALRGLLEQFRLPGEAQKIDRIMEKFAERYCKDNPNVFKTADAAYMLAFSIIMLNTDAHNPMAERMLNKATFVEMNRQQTDAGMDTVLPIEELESIYDRIVNKEITMRGEGTDSRKSHQFVLATAMGLTQLVTPFRALAASFGSKQSSAQLERIAILRQAEQALAQGTLSSVTWHIATHAEHTCPMLQVTGHMLFEALQWRLVNSNDVKQLEGVLSSLSVLIKLASLLGLDALCENCVFAVATASGVFKPAPPGSLQELVQLRSFKVLVGLPLSPEGGLLGSSWPIILRCLSAVEALQLEHLKASQQPVKVEDSGAGKSITKMFQAIGLSFNTTLGIKKPITPSGEGAHEDASADRKLVKDAPAVVLWAETEGHTLVERIYSQTSLLDGESVVVFVRALSAVSQEELELSEPRLFSLLKLVECAFNNMSRIRLVWSKMWSVVSSHLVGASCHPHSRVAMYAVDSLKQLVTKLLARAELANFTHQEEALRPFVSVLRQCDDPAVRELTVQCVVQAATSHPRGLGSGWKMVIEAVTRGVRDVSGPVVLQAMEALQIVVGALYRGPGMGHEFFVECLNAILAAIRNPHNSQFAAPAVQLLMLCAQRLAECHAQEQAYSNQVLAGWAPLLQALVELLSTDSRGSVVSACMDGLYEMMQLHSHCWGARTWEVVLNQVLDILFRLPSGELLSSAAEEQAVVDTFLARCERFVPRICERVAVIDEGLSGDLLQRLVGMSLAWTSHPSSRLSTAGLQSFEQMVLCLSPHLSPPSWLLLLSSLWVCVQALLNQMRAQFQQLLEIHSRTGLFLKPTDTSKPLDEPSLLLSNFHGRCRLMLLLQRSLGSIHAQCRQHMSPEVQLQLFRILKATVDTAVSINHMSASVLLPAMPAPVAPTITLTNKNAPPQPSATIKANRPLQHSTSRPEEMSGMHPDVAAASTGSTVGASGASGAFVGAPKTGGAKAGGAKTGGYVSSVLNQHQNEDGDASTTPYDVHDSHKSVSTSVEGSLVHGRAEAGHKDWQQGGGNTVTVSNDYHASGNGHVDVAHGEHGSPYANGDNPNTPSVLAKAAFAASTTATPHANGDMNHDGDAQDRTDLTPLASSSHHSEIQKDPPEQSCSHDRNSADQFPDHSRTNPAPLSNIATEEAAPDPALLSPSIQRPDFPTSPAFPTSPDPDSSVWSITSPGSAPIRIIDEYTVTPRADAMRFTGNYGNMPDGFAALPPVVTGNGPVVRSSPMGSDTVAPAVLRMEVQGGLMLIAAYKRALAMREVSALALRIDASSSAERPERPGLDASTPERGRDNGLSPDRRSTASGERDNEGQGESRRGVQSSNAAVATEVTAATSSSAAGDAGPHTDMSAWTSDLPPSSSAQQLSSSDSSNLPLPSSDSSNLPLPSSDSSDFPLPSSSNPPKSSSALAPLLLSPSPPVATHTALRPNAGPPVLPDDNPLWDFCCEILIQACQAVSTSPTKDHSVDKEHSVGQDHSVSNTHPCSIHNDNTSAAAATADTCPSSTSNKVPERRDGPAQRPRKLCGWYRDAHAPLIGSALEALREMKGAMDQKRLLELFPLLVGLIRYRHPAVQEALAGMWEDRVGPVITAACQQG